MITEEDFIDSRCPYCKETVSFPIQQRGSLQQCPMCFESLLAPEQTGQPAQAIPVPFSTERLTLRRLDPGDWKDLLEYLSDEQTFRFSPGHPLDEESILRWVEGDANVKLTTPDQPFVLGLSHQSQDKIIGHASLFLSTDLLQARLTIHLNPGFQKQGLASEALKGVLKFCFHDLKLHRVFATTDSRNEAAVELLEKLGLRREGSFLQDNLVQGEWRDTLWYAALRKDYEQHSTATAS